VENGVFGGGVFGVENGIIEVAMVFRGENGVMEFWSGRWDYWSAKWRFGVEMKSKRCFSIRRIDDITIPAADGKGELKRVDEVFDCRFESGRSEDFFFFF